MYWPGSGCRCRSGSWRHPDGWGSSRCRSHHGSQRPCCRRPRPARRPLPARQPAGQAISSFSWRMRLRRTRSLPPTPPQRTGLLHPFSFSRSCFSSYGRQTGIRSPLHKKSVIGSVSHFAEIHKRPNFISPIIYKISGHFCAKKDTRKALCRVLRVSSFLLTGQDAVSASLCGASFTYTPAGTQAAHAPSSLSQPNCSQTWSGHWLS